MARPHVKQDPTLPQGFSITFRKRFWEKVNKDGPIPQHMPHLGPCWLWVGCCNQKGYGQIGRGGRGGGMMLAHHASWLLTHGVLPSMCILHHCDNPPCENPSHLFSGTPMDNTRDMFAKHRNSNANRAIGTRNANAKLNDEKVRQMRTVFRQGCCTSYDIAEQYDVSQATAHNAITGNTWKHVV